MDPGLGDSSDEEEEEQDQNRLRMVRQLTKARVLKILAIMMLFLVSASILVASVVHDLSERRMVQFEEFSCSEVDIILLLKGII